MLLIDCISTGILWLHVKIGFFFFFFKWKIYILIYLEIQFIFSTI